MLPTRSLIALSFSSLLTLVSAGARITSPTSSDIVVAGQRTEIKWTSDSAGGTIGLSYCRGIGECQSIVSGTANDGSYIWTPSASLAPGNNYYLLIYASDGTTNNSDNFEISSTAPSSTTAGASSTSTPPRSSLPADPNVTTGSSTGPPASSTSPPSTDSNSSSSNGAIIGGAIAAVVVVILIAAIGFIWMRKRNQKKLAEAKRAGNSDVESGEKSPNGATPDAAIAAAAGKKSDKEAEAAPLKEQFAMAELPAQQQEAVEMSAVSAVGGSNQQFMVMELDSREIPRPGSASVKPDIDPTSATKSSMDKGDIRGASIDGTTMNSETERPKTSGTIDQIKEESREGSSVDLSHSQPLPASRSVTPAPFSGGPASRSGTPAPLTGAPASRSVTPAPRAVTPASRSGTPAQERPVDDDTAGPSFRDSTPQIGSLPKTTGFDFDIAKF